MEEGAGFEPAVFEICSHVLWATQPPFYIMEQDTRIELVTGRWQRSVLPLN